MIGTIVNGVYKKKEKESGRLRMGGGSWTVPMQVFDKSACHSIQYRTENSIYTIDKVEAWHAGFDRTFKGEEKMVVPLRHWKVKKI